MPNIEINLTGPSYPHRSRSLSTQRTVGFYPEIIDTQSKKSAYILNSFPGLKLFATAQGGKDRGMFEHKGILYKVTGTTLSTIDKDGVETYIGEVTGSGRCVIEGIGDSVVIVSDGNVWVVQTLFQDIDQYDHIREFVQISPNQGRDALEFSNDGKRMFTASSLSGEIYQFNLSSAWNMDTAEYFTKLSFAGANAVRLHEDIGKLYILKNSTQLIHQYSLGNTEDISTATDDSVTLDTSLEDSDPRDFVFNSDYDKIYTAGDTNNSIFQYNLTTAGDLSTGSYASKSLSVNSEDGQIRSIYLRPDGLKAYMAGIASDSVHQYTLSTSDDISTGSYDSKSLPIPVNAFSAGEITFKSDGSSLYALGEGYGIGQYNGFLPVSDVDLETPNSCAHLNNQILYDGDGGRFASSDVGDATSIDGLNYATAEVNADDIKRVYVFDQILYLMGEKTIESWYNSGLGSPPFDRIESGIMQIGLAAIYSVAHNDKFMYFLGDDNKVYRIAGTDSASVGTNALVHEIQGYTAIEDAIGYTFTFDNQEFYMLTFPSEQRSWCYSEQAQQWFEPSEGLYKGSSHVYAFRKNLIADKSNGNVYELDLDTYDENGELVERFRDSGPIHGGLLGSPGKHIELNRFELIMETGVGRLPSTADNRENPKIMLSLSYDGGKTYETEMWEEAGKMGDYIYKVEWHALGSGYDIRVRVKVSDPNFWSIHSASADIEVGI